MYLYAISESRDGPCKIGYAAAPTERIHELQIGNPRQLSLVWSVETEHYRRAERLAHRRAGLMHHIRGEWFAVNIAAAKEAVIFGCDEAGRIEAKRSQIKPTPLKHPLFAAALALVRR